LSSPRYGSSRGMPGNESLAEVHRPFTHMAATSSSIALGATRLNPMATALGPAATIDQVTTAIQECFQDKVPYFRIYTSILVACHSSSAMSTSLFSESAGVIYSDACYHDLDPTARDALHPHVFELTADAYTHLRRLRQDQVIVLSGVSGSGKSETAKMICDQLCVLASNSGRHNTRAQYQMAHVGAIVEAFACAQTAESMGATRAGLWHEIQFTERGHIAGSKLVAFGLDRWRVTSRPAGERTFNVFYYLLHGSTSDERQEWQFRHGSDESWFSYLKTTRPPKSHGQRGPPAAHYAFMMDQLRTALKVCGIKQHALFQVLAAIMHLGNVEFADAAEQSDTATVKNPDEVELAAQYLGVPAAALTAALSFKTALVSNDLCTVFLNSHGASAQRDALARALYHLVFYWLVDAINQNTSDPEATNHIAVLQMYGFS
ncbi:hypothetical protein GGI18_005468, partial [Coemansia linderi]